MKFLFLVLLFFSALFLILLILVQRGKGGGLAGAFGGLGGQSAFGTKAGDKFTRFTIGIAAAWIVLCILSVRLLGTSEDRMQLPGGGSTPVQRGADAQGRAGGARPAGAPTGSSQAGNESSAKPATPAKTSESGG